MRLRSADRLGKFANLEPPRRADHQRAAAGSESSALVRGRALGPPRSCGLARLLKPPWTAAVDVGWGLRPAPPGEKTRSAPPNETLSATLRIKDARGVCSDLEVYVSPKASLQRARFIHWRMANTRRD